MSESELSEKKTVVTAPAPKEPYVRIIPLGGLDEVGMNCCLIDTGTTMVMVDCGLTFPETKGYGVDIILPDMAYVLENLDKLDAVLLTHGHEDHIGALPFFLQEVDVPVYGGRLTLAMLTRKFEEHQLSEDDVTLHPVEAGDEIEVGEMKVEFIHINHSVPNAMSLCIRTPAGDLLFTGDWKLDHTPINEEPMDIQRIAQIGRRGVLALLADSTNSGTPGYSASESTVQDGLAAVFDQAEGRLIVGQFSSNIHRVQGMLELAVDFGRKVVLQGRSMKTNFELAAELGFIDIPQEVELIDVYDIKKYPDNEILIITTGSQAEPRAGLTRMAYSDHRVKLKPTDTVVLSARQIPGNEVAISKMIDHMSQTGARVITQRDAPIHATGHAKREELKMLIALVRPEFLIPMHGSFSMRKTHADLGDELGVPHTLVIEDGDVLDITASKQAKVADRIHAGRVFVDGRSTGNDVAMGELRDRRKLAHSGIIVAMVMVDRKSGKITGAPELLHRGFLSGEHEGLLDQAANHAKRALDGLSAEVRTNSDEVSEALGGAIRGFFRKQLDRKPVVIPIVHEM